MARQIVKDFFVYSTGRVAVANGATVTTNISIQADADFEILKLTGTADIAGAAETANSRVIPNATILITDTGSGRQLMNVPVPFWALFGSAENPFILPQPKLIAARSNLQVTITSYEAANTNNIDLSFIGNKIFQYN